MNKITFHNQNNKGAAMILAIIVIAVMSLLGTAMWMYSTTDTLHASHEEKKIQAYYVARSAAETVAEYIIKTPSEVSDIIAKNPGTGNMGGSESNRTYSVTVTDLGNGFIDVQATGTVGGISDKATLRLAKRAVTAAYAFSDAIFAMQDIQITGSSYNITGNVSANGEIKASDKSKSPHPVKFTEKLNPPRPYPTISIPYGVSFTSYTTLDLTKFPGGIINNNLKLDTFDVGRDTLVTFDTSGGDIYLDVATFKSGKIKITGSNHVYMFVNSFTLLGGGSINEGVNPSQFIIIESGANSTITFENGGNSVFYGVIYAPNTAIWNHGTPDIYGAIISKDFKGNGTVKIDNTLLSNTIVLPVTDPKYLQYEKVQWR